jgi:hypothetical protein
MIDAEWVETGLGRPRKYYNLTPSGRRRTIEMARLWAKFTQNFEALMRPVGTDPGPAVTVATPPADIAVSVRA